MKAKKIWMVAFVAILGLHSLTRAEEGYPKNPIRWVVPNPAGGGTDAVVRTIANAMAPLLGQPLVVDNKPGGATMIGADTVARSRPDGYTILTGDNATFATNSYLYKKISYDPIKDFRYINLMARFPLALISRANFPAKTLPEAIAYAKANPGKINFATPGTGLPHHLAMELLMERTGTKMTHVPYKGSPPALQALMAGEIDMMFLDLASGMSFLKDGRVRVYGVASAQRFEGLPEVKTLQELGLDGFEVYAWQGVVVPAGTDASIVNRLNAEFKTVLQDPAIRKKLVEIGVEPLWSTPEEFSRYVASERSRWGKLIDSKGIKLE